MASDVWTKKGTERRKIINQARVQGEEALERERRKLLLHIKAEKETGKELREKYRWLVCSWDF